MPIEAGTERGHVGELARGRSLPHTGSGVFALAACTLALAAGPLAAVPARRVVALASACGLVAFLVDVYLY